MQIIKMIYINKTTKYLYFSRPIWLEESQVLAAYVAVTDSIMENKNAILYYKDTFSQWFISPIVLEGKEYQRFKNLYVNYPLLANNGRIFSQYFQNLPFYEDGNEYTQAKAGICRLTWQDM
jgi:hypothetical protein